MYVLGRIVALVAPKNETLANPQETLLTAKSPASAPVGNCLSYAPARVTLVGTLRSQAFRAPLNAESSERPPETYWILNLGIPVCTNDGEPPSPNRRESDVWNLQLIFTDAEMCRTYRPLLNSTVAVTGSLFSATNAQHHTKVVLQVTGMERPQTPNASTQSALAAASSIGGTCLSYGPAVVTLKGTITPKTFPGRPNFESIERGDEPEAVWILALTESTCTSEQKVDEHTIEAEANVRELQLTIGDQQLYERYQPLLGRTVNVSGTLDHAVTGHHHTPVILDVTGIEPSAGSQ